jgi:uroporphyrinogen-III synthase
LDFVGDILEYDWIIFTSTNAVKYFFRFVEKKPETIQTIRIACVGNKTASLLTEFNLKAALTPKKYTTRDLLTALQNYELKGKRVLIPVSNLARHDLEQGLQAFGARVQRIEVYKNVPYNNPKKKILYQRICDDLVDCITFFSPSALDSFIDVMGKEVVTVVNSKRIALAVIGPTTAKAALERGLKPAILPEKSESHSLLLALEQYYANIK